MIDYDVALVFGDYSPFSIYLYTLDFLVFIFLFVFKSKSYPINAVSITNMISKILVTTGSEKKGLLSIDVVYKSNKDCFCFFFTLRIFVMFYY